MSTTTEKEKVDILSAKYIRDPKSFVFISCLLMFIPFIISLFTQPVLIAVIIGLAAFWSCVYHTYSENVFGDMDIIWANITTGVICVLLNLVLLTYGFKSWRFIIPFIISLTSALIYIFKGYSKDPVTMTERDKNEYEVWHGIWHTLAAVSAIFLVISPIDYNNLRSTYAEAFTKKY